MCQQRKETEERKKRREKRCGDCHQSKSTGCSWSVVTEESESRGIPAAGLSAKRFAVDESELTAIANAVKLMEYEKLLIFTLTAPTPFTNSTKQNP